LSTLNNQSVLSVDEKMGQTYIGDNVGNTLGARDYKQPQAVVYGICSDEGGNNMPIVLEGNGQRDSHKGDGYKESETMYTLNTVEQHGVCTYQQTTGALTPGAHPGSYNGHDAYNDMLIVGGVQNQSQQVKPHFF